MSDIIRHEPDVQSIARFQSLQAGQYWRALEEVPEQGIPLGTVLLIESIRHVDDVPHTIILRAHPSMYDQVATLTYVDENGKTIRRGVRYKEHRFLTAAFLKRFEYEPNHQSIRAAEIAGVQSRIAALQSELVETQSRPELLALVVEAGLRKDAEQAAKKDSPPEDEDDELAEDEFEELDPEHDGDNARDESPSPTTSVPVVQAPPDPVDSKVVALATGSVANAIGAGVTVETIEAMKQAAKREHQIATIQATWITGKTQEIAETIQRLTPFYAELAAAALAHTEEKRTYVGKLVDGIASLDLYVGKDVQVEQIRKGVSAPRGMPLTIVQAKLRMDEELAVWQDVNSRFDHNSQERFFDALREHDGLVEQIFPAQRCILVMATTRREIDYGSGLASAIGNSHNRRVFMLVRDGMNIYRVDSPVESHLGTARLFPSLDEQLKIFRGSDGSQIKFEDVSFTDKNAKHDRLALHYKRLLLLCCGLDHRLRLFGDFYDGPKSMDFVSMAFQEAHMRFIHDDDSGSLPGESRPSVSDWIKEKNAYMRSGSRMLCNWFEIMNPDTAPAACRAYSGGGFSRDEFVRLYEPTQSAGLAIAFKDGNSVCVDVEVSGRTRKNTHRTFICKVNLSAVKPQDFGTDDLPFLCLDAVDPDDLNWYIHNRRSRIQHLSFIRFFKQALAFVRAEREAQADTRARLAQALADGGVGSPDERDVIIDQAVIAWRAANRGKPLPEFDGNSKSSAWKSLLDQMYMLAGEGKRRVADVEAFAREHGLEPLRLTLSADARLVVYLAPDAKERDDRLTPHTWVHRVTLDRTQLGLAEKGRAWVDMPLLAASETTLHEWPGCKEWAGLTSIFPTPKHKREALDATVGYRERLAKFSAPLSQQEHDDLYAQWVTAFEDATDKSKQVSPTTLVVPIGVVRFRNEERYGYLCAGCDQPHALLARLAPNEASRNRVERTYVAMFENKTYGRSSFNAAIAAPERDWNLMMVAKGLSSSAYAPFADYHLGVSADELTGGVHSPLLADVYAKYQKHDPLPCWLADGVVGADGRLALDSILGLSLPEDYELITLFDFTLYGGADKPIKYNRWVDLVKGDQAGERSSFFSTRNKDLTDALIESVAKKNSGGCSHTAQVCQSRAAAIAAVQSRAKDKQRAVPSTELADSPPPPPGVQRWYIVTDV